LAVEIFKTAVGGMKNEMSEMTLKGEELVYMLI
jgi:hypothetical protein